MSLQRVLVPRMQGERPMLSEKKSALSGSWSRWHQVSAGSKQPRGDVGEGPYQLYRSRTHLFSTVRSARLALADGGSIPAPLLECSMTYLSQSFSTWALLSQHWVILCGGGCPVHCRTLSSTVGLYSLGHNSAPLTPSCDNCFQLRTIALG